MTHLEVVYGNWLKEDAHIDIAVLDQLFWKICVNSMRATMCLEPHKRRIRFREKQLQIHTEVGISGNVSTKL